jgi:putative lipoic acid-binding regulatory protein
MGTPDPKSLIEYPCLFPIKVMGENSAAFAQAIIEIALRFDPGFDSGTLQQRPSRGGKYLGLTLNFHATSRQQLDALYRSLSGHPLVRVVL